MNSTKAKAKAKAISKKKSINQKSDQSKITVVDQTDKQREFLFTVIIPVYNCAQYLPEAIDSVVAQTIGFDKIQVILVNDGSPDNSDEVCRVYQAKYPDNIIYLKQPNAGVSAARNLGMKYMTGRYVNFLDSDDKWQNDVFAKAARMFRKHPETDVIGVRIHCFEATDAYHPLDYKFDRDKVVDIFNEYDHIQLSSASALFRADSVRNRLFDDKLKFGEDAKFVFGVLLDRGKLGILASSEYMYRKRNANDSAIQGMSTSLDYYDIMMRDCHLANIKASLDKYGFVIPYLQYAIMYEYQWRVKLSQPNNVPEDIFSKYIDMTRDIFQYIDDYIIIGMKKLSPEYKYAILKFKYGSDEFSKHISYRKHMLYFKNIPLMSFRPRRILSVRTFNVDNDRIVITGVLNCCLPYCDYKLIAVVNGIDVNVDFGETMIDNKFFLGRPYDYYRGFELSINRRGFKSVYFKLVYKGLYVTNLLPGNGSQSKLAMGTPLYYVRFGRIFTYKKNRMIARKKSIRSSIGSFVRCVKWLVKSRQYDMLLIRCFTVIRRRFLRARNKRIWLFCDRPNVANDNGAALFEYVCKHRPANVVPYFAVDRNTDSYRKMKTMGRVVGYGTNKYKRLFLLANKNISSQADEWVVNPFGKDSIYIKDLYRADFIFLQHGVIKDDLSSWLNVYAKDIDGFVCTTHDEAKSLVNPKYGYSKPTIWMTGLPRYDKLSSKPNNEVLVMPTWRRGLASPLDPKTDTRPYSNKVANSAFCKFYSSLINDGRILKVLQECGYQLKLVLHPSMGANVSDFTSDSVNVSVSTNANYSELFKEGNLMVTDYSSVAFDFAYLKKPVIYAQFDKEDFFAEQIYNPGYFSYEKDGFGPVCYDYESTVKAICDAIKGGCKMPKKYQDRVDRTFAYHDHDNCKRVLDKILAMK